ncbi:MAG TPA: acyltransferase [Candidatus Acidoferrum sp.]|nr:acyltransferase [Candidatus Acidoferrum sp.]
MATQSVETEPGPRPGLPSLNPLVWMPRKLSATASDSFDLIRAVAAFAVMIGHLRTFFFVDFQHLQSKSFALQVLYFLTGFGHQAVVVFFVLSGFLISSTILRSHILGKWSWRHYAVNRGTRLYVVLLPGLLLGFFWDRLGSWLFSAKGIYAHSLSDLGPAVPLQNLTPANFLGNLFFLQTILSEPFGSNGPLWSLANEFWYYVLFPLALAAGVAWAGRRFFTATAFTFLALCIAVFVGRGIMVGFLIWLAGFALVLLYSKVRIRSGSVALVLVCFFSLLAGGMLAIARVRQWDPLLIDLEVGLAFTLFLFALLQFEVGENSSRYSVLAHRFAGFSYSLYVLHFPFLLFFRSWFVPEERWQPSPIHLLAAAAVGAGTVLYAWLVSRLTEARTDLARAWVNRVLSGSGNSKLANTL